MLKRRFHAPFPPFGLLPRVKFGPKKGVEMANNTPPAALPPPPLFYGRSCGTMIFSRMTLLRKLSPLR